MLTEKLAQSALERLTETSRLSQTHRNLGRTLLRWEKEGLLHRVQQSRSIVYCLTNDGRRRLEQFHDVQSHWEKPWDGLWRAFLFDLPSHDHKSRMMLWR
ncbi:MAG: hypothetical protein N3B01_08290, partial [Verrucomicrobiae bacterium]|nr:hypothetical protein [Verrucomicrobiae bacterium]